MKTLFVDETIKYEGHQLAPHFIYKNFHLLGDSIIAFMGPVDVKIDEMVDLEDVINNEPISSDLMLSFIVEIFDIGLNEGVFAQRMLVQTIKEELEDMGFGVKRQGDDLFFKGKKLSVSIATKSLTSVLIHTALNVVSTGAPIEVASLNEIGISDVKKFAQNVMIRYSDELSDIKCAIYKVRGV